jgi:hypothetical protein
MEDVTDLTSYRLNIFGYPNAAALDGKDMNPGLLDHRLAVEWIHDHIRAFGGDPDRMILFGQSAGYCSPPFSRNIVLIKAAPWLSISMPMHTPKTQL